jgi:dTDP-4-dehydrorhamnose reductase
MLHLAETRHEIKVVNDQYGCPTYAGDLAQAMILLAVQPEARGIYHYCGDEPVSWCEFAQALFIAVKKDISVFGIRSTDYPTAAVRPLNSQLCCDKIKKMNIKTSDWQSYLLTIYKNYKIAS